MQKKIFITFTILLVVGIILAGLLTLSFVRTTYEENIENRLITNAQLINQFVTDQISESDFEKVDFSNYSKEYSRLINTRVSFIDVNGTVIGDSAVSDLRSLENHLNRPEIQEALDGKIGINKRNSSTLNVNYLYIAVPLIVEDKMYGVTRVALPLYELNQLNYKLLQNYIVAALCGLVVSTILGYKYANSVTRPIIKITDTAKKIANGKLNDRVHINSSDEIGELADTFNFMAEKLDMTITEIHDKNTKLQSTLASMNEALFAVDKTYKIILINPVAMTLFNIEEENVYGKHILEVVRNNKLHNLFKDILENNNLGETEVTIDYPVVKTLRVFTNFIRLEMDPNRIIGVMALIQDITEVRRLENMRSDFVANVSHELKTPLTSITGFIETLKNGSIENEMVRNRFLDIIEIETERLTRLIDDLLSLSAIESNSIFSKRDTIETHEILSEVGVIVEGLIEQKRMEFIVEIESSLPNIKGNKDWFKQMLLNLVENALKYTPEEGTVKVLVYKRYDNIFISVKDKGIGIPKEDIPRLFERFYRVDKARSRKVGGTGLGLAIVKHIVISFKGEIKVNSEVGKGSEFIVRIPISQNNS